MMSYPEQQQPEVLTLAEMYLKAVPFLCGRDEAAFDSEISDISAGDMRTKRQPIAGYEEWHRRRRDLTAYAGDRL